jgi:hypothetical protein
MRAVGRERINIGVRRFAMGTVSPSANRCIFLGMFLPPLPPPPRISAVELRICPGYDPKCYFELANDVFEGVARSLGSSASSDSAAVPKHFDDIRQAIINGLVSAQSEPAGWNAVRSEIPVSAVVRTSDTVVTITLPPLPGYDITAPETITATVPACAVVGATPITATPSIVVRPDPAHAG